MSDQQTIDVLNRLMAIHYRSLPMYLSHAPPWKTRGDERAAETLGDVVADQQQMCHRFSAEIQRRGGTIDTGEFPTEYTDMHFLSLDYVLGRLIDAQRQDIAQIESCVAAAPDAEIRALAEESLGMAKGHLDSLEELAAKKVNG